VAQGSAAVKIYNATIPMGVYSHGPMISFNDGFFLASWKNGVLSEDQPGQRVLWSWATEAAPLKYSAPAVLFPNMSTGEPCVAGGHPPFPKNHSLYPPNPSYLSPACAHLFAEPTVVLGGRVYLAASLRQFCLWPLDRLNEGGKYLVLRRVTLSPGSPPKLGPIFWGLDPGPEWSETNARLGIRTLAEMDAETRADTAALLTGARPCEDNATKCEYCKGEATISSDSVTTIAILKEHISQEAVRLRITLTDTFQARLPERRPGGDEHRRD